MGTDRQDGKTRYLIHFSNGGTADASATCGKSSNSVIP